MKKATVVTVAIVLSLAMISGICFAQDAKFKKTITGSGQVTGPCRLVGISMRSATAGDNIGVYDYNSVSNSGNRAPNIASVATDIEFELGVSVGNSSAFIPCYNAPMTYGVYVLSTSSTAVTTVLFDY